LALERSVRKLSVVGIASAFALCAGCGDSTETESPTTIAASSGPTAGAPTTSGPTAGAVGVTLTDNSIGATTSLKAGVVTFAITNLENTTQHELVVIKGKFAELPKLSNGAVDEAKLAAGAFIGRTESLRGGDRATATYTLDPGNYVLLCNINSGPNSHARDGQRLDVMVA
jgi:hypothetical protein